MLFSWNTTSRGRGGYELDRQEGWDCPLEGGLQVDHKEEGGWWPPEWLEGGSASLSALKQVLTAEYLWCGNKFVWPVWKNMTRNGDDTRKI